MNNEKDSEEKSYTDRETIPSAYNIGNRWYCSWCKQEYETRFKALQCRWTHPRGELGPQVRSLYELMNIAREKGSVVVPKDYCWKNPKPAAFVINLQGPRILAMFNAGLYRYIPVKKNKSSFKEIIRKECSIPKAMDHRLQKQAARRSNPCDQLAQTIYRKARERHESASDPC